MKCALILFALIPTAALARQAPDSKEAAPSDERWSLGVATAIIDSPYAGEGTRVLPLPLIGYEGERWFFRETTAGMHVLDKGGFQLNAIVAGRFNGFDIHDLGAAALASNGLDARLLQDRRHGIDAGLGVSWSNGPGVLRLQAVADVSGASGGQEVSAEYLHQFQAGRWTLAPGVGVRWKSSDLTQYYYGILDKEVARGVARYAPGAVIVPTVSFSAIRPVGERWKLYAGFEYSILPRKITDSPLLEKDVNGEGVLAIGFNYSF